MTEPRNQLIASDRIADPKHFRPIGIKGLTPGLLERGKIKIGIKGAVRQTRDGNSSYQLPQKLDHFIVTSTVRGADGNFQHDSDVMQLLGAKPTEIPIRLVYDDIDLNFPARYACYQGKTLFCTGDGERARRARIKSDKVDGYDMVPCTCERQDPSYEGKDKCKITGTLSVMIDGAAAVGGVWKFRTTSYNSVVGIMSSLAMISRISGGRLAGIPLTMKLTAKTVQEPVTGSQQTIYVVGIEYKGTVEQLRDSGYKALLDDKTHGARIEDIERHARLLIAQQHDEYEVEADDIADEFFPEQAAGDLPTTEAEPAQPEPQMYPSTDFERNLPKWREVIENGRKTPDDIINMVKARGNLTEKQIKTLREIKKAPTESEPQPIEGELLP